MVNRVLRAFLLAFAALVLSAGPALADCAEAPPPNTPNDGSWGGMIDTRPYPFFDETPESVEDATGPNPFEDASSTTVYHEYGWGSWKVHNYDPPDQGVPYCADNRAVAGWVGKITNTLFNVLTAIGAFGVLVVRMVFNPVTMSVFDPIMRLFIDATGNRFFVPLFPIALAVTGAYIMWRAREGRVKDAGKDAGASLGIAVVALACVVYGMFVMPKIDNALTGALASVGETVVNPVDEDASKLPGGSYDGEPMSLPESIAANLVEAVVFPTWCSAQIGRGANPGATEKCDELFMASTLSRTEAAAINANPDLADEIIEAKAEEYADVAEDIEEADKLAYAYLSGERAADRIAPTLLGLFAMVLAGGMLAYTMSKFFLSLVIIRLTAAIFPLIAVAAQHPAYRWMAARAGDVAWAAVFNGLLFGTVSILWAAAGIGALLSPENGLPIIASMVLMLIGSIAILVVANRYKITPEFLTLNRAERRAQRQAKSARARERQERTPHWEQKPDLPQPGDAPPADPPRAAAMPRRTIAAPQTASVAGGAARGAAQAGVASAALGAVTGGTVTAGALAVGAARGGYQTHRQNKAAQEAHRTQVAAESQTLPYYPASSVRRGETQATRPMPEGNPSRARNLTKTAAVTAARTAVAAKAGRAPAAGGNATPLAAPAQHGGTNLPVEARARAARSATKPVEGVVIYHPAQPADTPAVVKPRTTTRPALNGAKP